MKKIYLLLVALSFSFSGFSQTTIFQENFEAFGNGAVTTSTTNSDIGAWNSSGTALCNGTTFWGIYDTGSGIITNRGLKPATATTACVVSPGNYNLTSTVSNLYAYTTISTTGYTSISLEFDWKCTGENIGTTVYDYGSVVYRVGTTGSWIQLATGGTTVGKYYNNNPTTAPRAVISLPATLNNQTKIQFGFRWDNDSSAGAAPAFSIDNIVVKGTSSCTAPTTQATAYSTTSIVAGAGNTGTATLNWTRGTGTNVLVVMRAISAVTSDPVSGTSYTANAAYGTPAAQLGTTGNYVVYNGLSTTPTINVTNLTENTTYHVAIYEYITVTNCYKTPALTGNFTVPCVTPINVTAFTATAAVSQVGLTWTNSACFDEVLVVAKASTAVTAVPTGNGSAYTANAAFGSGTQIATGEFVVYKNTGATVNVTALTNGTTYHFKVFTRKGSVWSSGVVANATPSLNYCTANGNMSFATSITLVNFAGINNITAKLAAYTSYLAQTATVNKGATLPLNVRLNTDGNYNVYSYAFIDWNQNGVFTDAGETYDLGLVNNNANGLTTMSPKSISIPSTATLGNTRMRVTCQYYTTTIPTANSCMTGVDGEVEDYSVNVLAPITYTYNNGWVPSDPNGQSTSLNTIIVANGSAVISSNIGANTVTVNPTGALTVNTGNTLTVVNGLNLQSNSTQYSSLLLNGSISGTINYNRHVNGYNTVGVGTGNDLISAPVTSGSQTFGAFVGTGTNNANLRANPSPGLSTQKLFGPFSKTTGTYLLWDSTTNASEVLTAGVGYRAATINNGNLTFTGSVLKSNVTASVSNSGPQFASYNLIGNPYTSYINVRDFLEEDLDGIAGPPLVRNIDLMVPTNAAIYGYDGTASNGWVIYNLLTSPTVNMTPGQGFLVTAAGTSSMTFTPTMRRNDTTDDLIPGRRAIGNSVHVTLQAAIGASNYMTNIYFDDNCSSGLDVGYDAGVYGSNAPATAIYTHMVQDNTGVDMAIQSLAYADLGTDIIVPLGINVPQGQQVTVSILETDFPANIEVILEDNVANTFTVLNTSDYIFTANTTLNDTGRFFLRFADATLSTPEANINGLQIYTTASPRALFIKGQLSSATEVTLYDIQGRMVAASTLDVNSNSNQVEVSNLSSGVYVVKLSNSAQQKTQKVILK